MVSMPTCGDYEEAGMFESPDFLSFISRSCNTQIYTGEKIRARSTMPDHCLYPCVCMCSAHRQGVLVNMYGNFCCFVVVPTSLWLKSKRLRPLLQQAPYTRESVRSIKCKVNTLYKAMEPSVRFFSLFPYTRKYIIHT